MARPLLAVIFGTFTLRLSTGLTGGALVYYLNDLEKYGGPAADALTVATFAALFYASELVGSPLFGVLSDRLGHRRVMLVGPVFGAIAVVITAFSTNLLVLGGTRVLEGASTAASVPSILGFIAFATAGDEALRGRATARFEAATLAGLMGGFVLVGPAVPAARAGRVPHERRPLRGLVRDLQARRPGGRRAAAAPRAGRARDRRPCAATGRSCSGSHVWLLAPTWIAINATLGLFTSATLFQLVNEPSPGFEDQLLMGGLSPALASVGLAIGGLLFFAGIFWWGRRFASMRRTTIIFYGILGGAALLVAAVGINHSGDVSPIVPLGLAVLAIAGLFVLAGATPAAIGLLADVTEAYPDDRGAIMGLYSVFLGLGQIVGAIVGGIAAEAWGLDGIFGVALVLLGIALVPLVAPAAVRALRRRPPGHDGRRVIAPFARGARGAVVAPHHLATAAGLAVLAAGGHAVDAAIATNAVLAVVLPNGCGLGGDAFWLVWDEAAGEQVGLNGSGRAPAAADAAALRARGLERIPLRGPLGITVPGAVRSWADAHRRWGRLSRDAILAAAIEHAADGFAMWEGLAGAIERTHASLGGAPWATGFDEVWRPDGRAAPPGGARPAPGPARRPCGRWSTRASTRSTTASWASGSRWASRRPAARTSSPTCAPIAASGRRRSRRPTAACAPRPTRPTRAAWWRCSRSTCCASSSRRRAPGSRSAAGPTPPGSTRCWRSRS